MATPASSATSPSPPMAYLSHAPLTPQPTMPSVNDFHERDQRQKAVQKFLARAEISVVTRALRARLSYASYKAVHNIPHVPLRDLEAQTTQIQAASFTRTIAAKRKASGLPQSYYPAPGTPGPSTASPGPGSLRKSGSGAMLPPSSVNSPRTHYPSVNGHPSSAAHGETTSRHPFNTAPNLYTSILAPPPAKHARTIHNASDPPVPAPTRPAPSPRPRSAHKSPRTEVGRSHAKSRHSDKSKSTQSPDRRKVKRASADKGKRKQANSGVDADGDVDMKAVVTLTSLRLHHSRPSIGSASSPRSSIDGSETGSTLSYSHYAQSSARSTSGAIGAPSSVNAPSTSTPGDASLRHRTPPPSSAPIQNQSTPHAMHTAKDSEAADLMLFLATSPSPARTSKARDQTAYQALSGGDSARPKGRVLFASGSASEQHPGESPGGQGLLRAPPNLLRSGEGSFTSSISSIGSDLGGNRNPTSPSMRTISSPGSAPNQLLPPPPLSSLLPAAAPNHAAPKKPSSAGESPRPSNQGSSQDINFSEYINASPSPARAGAQGLKPNHSLRADVGRKLFEEEQMRFAAQGLTSTGNPLPGAGAHGVEQRGESQHERVQQQSWSAGINVAQS